MGVSSSLLVKGKKRRLQATRVAPRAVDVGCNRETALVCATRVCLEARVSRLAGSVLHSRQILAADKGSHLQSSRFLFQFSAHLS